jgi:hypothetical protein
MTDKLEEIVVLCLKSIDPDLSMTSEQFDEFMSDIASGGNHDDTFRAGETQGAHDMAKSIIDLINKE